MRSILIFPEIYNLDSIQATRAKYDSEYQHINPHISLVFPFDSNVSDSTLIQLVSPIIQNTKSFPITFNKLGFDDHGYIWLEAAYGQDKCREIHDKLYATTTLLPFLNSDIPYTPHLTIAHVPISQQADVLSRLDPKKLEFSTYIDEISIETIADDLDSQIITTIPLK